MVKNSKDFKYEIVEIMGTLDQEADIRSAWCKSVLKTLLNDNEGGIDIRNYNAEKKIMGSSGIRLTVQEANNLVDLLLKNGYGSSSVIEEAHKQRQSLFV